MAIEIRHPAEAELRPTLEALSTAFGSALDNGFFESAQVTMPLERVFTAFDGEVPVAVSAAFPFSLSIPGGELPCGGVTWVGVWPTHRRRGLATELMRRQLHDLHALGEPLAALWASESSIYARYGYGMAAPTHSLDADRSGFAFRDDPGRQGTIRLVRREEAVELLPPVYDRVRSVRNGMPSRSRTWWEKKRAADQPGPAGTSPRFYAVVEFEGVVEGYAIYRMRERWEQALPAGEVLVIEALGTSLAATRDIWRFLFSIDLTTRVTAEIVDPAAPLFFAVADPRRLQLRLNDGMWLRLVDVAAALAARSWAVEDTLVVDLRDDFCPWNEGRYRIGSGAGRDEGASADLSLDVRELATVYLGGVDLQALAAAGWVEEHTPGALERAAGLFRTPLPPFCPEEF